jgi:hypothetical protein
MIAPLLYNGGRKEEKGSSPHHGWEAIVRVGGPLLFYGRVGGPQL